MSENFAVRTIYHVADTWRPFSNFFYTVGDDPDVTLNPKCSETAYASGGLYECHLNGKFFGIVKPDAGRVSVCELRLFSRKSAVPHFPITSTPFHVGSEPTNPGTIGPHSFNCAAKIGDCFDCST